MKRFTKIMAILMVTALIMSIAAISASAATSYTAIPGTSTKMVKNLVLDSDARVPQVSFNYTISSGEGAARAATATTIEILAGPVVTDATGKVTAPVVESATFTGNETTKAGTPTDSTDTSKIYASTEATIDLSGVTFSKPGVYRYYINEVNESIPGVTYDTTARRVLDVFVVADSSDKLSIQSYVLRKSADNILLATTEVTDGEGNTTTVHQYDNNPDEKSAGYTNTLTTYDLVFSKTITGNQADKNKDFTFTLTLSNVNPGLYTIKLADGSESTISVTPSETAVGTYSGQYTLTNGQSIKVIGLNSGAHYIVSENSQDYTPSVTVTGTGYTVNDAKNQVSGDMAGDVTAAFTNTREGVIPTGVLLTIAPFAVGILLFGAIAFFLISKRRREDY